MKGTINNISFSKCDSFGQTCLKNLNGKNQHVSSAVNVSRLNQQLYVQCYLQCTLCHIIMMNIIIWIYVFVFGASNCATIVQIAINNCQVKPTAYGTYG